MRAILLSVTCLSALTLAACDSNSGTIFTEDGESVDYAIDGAGDGKDITTSTITGPDGQEVVQQSGADVPVDLPDGFSVYPKAEIVSNMVTKMGGASGSTMMLQSDAMPKDIAAYYKDQAEKAGMEIEIDLDMDTNHTVAGDRASDGTKMTVSATRDEGADSTTVMLSVVTEPEG